MFYFINTYITLTTIVVNNFNIISQSTVYNNHNYNNIMYNSCLKNINCLVKFKNN